MSTSREILEWYRDSGIDYPLQDTPIDQFAFSKLSKVESRPQSQSKSKPSAPPAKRQTTPPSPPTIPDEQAVKNAIELSRGAKDLVELRTALENFTGCNLRSKSRTTVFSDGNPSSDLMIIGEASGHDEDEHGLPFVGSSGQLLDKILLGIGRDRTNTYLTNVISWHPPGNRLPTQMEMEICRPFVERHISLISPKIILLMGGLSTKSILRTTTDIVTLRGKWQDIEIAGETYRAMPTFHPSYLLRQPLQKRLSWLDFLMVRSELS